MPDVRAGGGILALADVFRRAREEDRAVLVGYLPACFPSYDGCLAAFRAMIDAGVDAVEVGLPYSDPLIDGPTIQQAADHALRAGATTARVLDTAAAIAALGVPTLIMTYWNPVERFGVRRFARAACDAGVAGVIAPDLTPEEGGAWLDAAAECDLAPVFLVAPSSTDARISSLVGVTRGFVYAASTMGVTGTRSSIGSRAGALVARIRAATDLPVAVGLGVSSGAQAAEVAAYADGVIVGSAFVRALLDAEDEPAGVEAVRRLASDLAAGVRGEA